SSSPRRGVALPLAGFLFVMEAFFLAGASSSSSSSSSTGSSTTKRYLHLGQSIFRPMSLGSRIGTIASQLGHCCLKLILAAMKNSPNGQNKHPVAPRKGFTERCSSYHKQEMGGRAKRIL